MGLNIRYLPPNPHRLRALGGKGAKGRKKGFPSRKTKLTLGQHLRIDESDGAFLGSDAANALLAREDRTPFLLPKESGI